MKTKICTKCGKRKPLSGFYKDCSKKDGIRNYCKDCANEMSNSYRKARNGKKRLEGSKKSFKKAIEEEVLNRKQVRSFITEEDLTVAKVANAIKTSVKAIADMFDLEASVMVKLKPKTK